MNQVFNQSKNKRIIVISFLSLSPISNTSSNVFELFASFKAANALNHWNLSLIQAVQNCVLVGHIDPHVIMLGGSQNYLEIIKLAWMKQILKSPLGFTIQYLGELCNFLVSKTPQCSTVELEEAICKCVCELVNIGLQSNLKNIIRYVTKFLPVTGDNSVYDSENFLSTEMIKSIIDNLQQKGLVYNTGHGYNVMTADKLRVAKWLGELPDSRLSSFSGSDSDDKRPQDGTASTPTGTATQRFQRPSNRPYVATGRERGSENTDDCLSCYDLRGNKYYSQPTVPVSPAPIITSVINGGQTQRTNFLDTDNNNIRDSRIISNDASLNKPRMLCSQMSKKDLPKRSSCVKYESNFITRIICGMKKLRIHWPAKNGVVRSTNIGVPEVYNNEKNYFSTYIDDSSVLNSRLSQSMYAFNQFTSHHCSQIPGPDPITDNEDYLDSQRSPTDLRISDNFLPYGLHCPPSAADIDRSFQLMEEQRCCSELMLTGRGPLYHRAIVPSPHDASSNTKHDSDQPTIAGNNRCYFSPFTCDSGFNSVHGGAPLLPENDASQSKTSSPPDMTSSKKLSQSQYYGGPLAWQISPVNENLFQSRTYQSPVLAPVIEAARYSK